MANMSYCQFRNTLADLRDCQEEMDGAEEVLSREEREARTKLIRVCVEIARDFGGDL